MEILNKKFESGQVLKAEYLTDIVNKINEIIKSINNTSSEPEDESISEEQ